MTSQSELFTQLIPGYADLAAAADRAEQAIIDAPRGTDPRIAYDEALERVHGALAAGRPVTLDMTRPAAAATADEELMALHAGVLHRVESRLRNDLDQLVSSSSKRVFSHLNDRVQAVVEQTRAAASTLNGARSGDEAILRGGKAITAWKTVVGLVDEYETVRNLQLDMIRRMDQSSMVAPMGWWQRTGIYRRSIDLVEYWTARRHSAAAESNPDFQDGDRLVTWLRECPPAYSSIPVDVEQRPWWPKTADGAGLLRIVRHELWVPDAKQLQQAHRAASAACVFTSWDVNKQQIDAIHEYYEIVGVDLPATVPSKISLTNKPYIAKAAIKQAASNSRSKTEYVGVPIGGQ